MITPDEAKRELQNCIGDCDKCKYHYYDMMSPNCVAGYMMY